MQLVQQLPTNRPILFAPDANLGRWVARQSGRELTLWPGSCIVHETFSEQALLQLKLEHPDAEVIAHPECQQHLLDLADFIGSTSSLLRHAVESPAPAFIVLTEPGILHQMQRALPHKTFRAVPGQDGCSCNTCPYMRLNTLEKLWRCLDSLNPTIAEARFHCLRDNRATTVGFRSVRFCAGRWQGFRCQGKRSDCRHLYHFPSCHVVLLSFTGRS